jgi:hypothetical protein
MKRKKIKIAGTALFVYRPKNNFLGLDTDPTTNTMTTVTSTNVFQK